MVRIRVTRESIHRQLRETCGEERLPHQLHIGCVLRFRVRREIERDGTGDVRRGHTGSGDRSVPAVIPSRENADAGRREGDGGSVIAEAREGVISLTGPAGWRRTERARFAIRVRDRRHRDDVRIIRGTERQSIRRGIAGRGDKDDALCSGRIDCEIQSGTVAKAAEAHIDDSHLIRMTGEVIDPRDDVRDVPAPATVEHLHGPESRPGRDAHNPDGIVERAHRPGHVRAVSVVIIAAAARILRAPRDDVHVMHDVQVGMREVDPRVEDRDVRIHAIVRTIDGRRGTLVSADASHSRRDDLRRRDSGRTGSHHG